MSFTSGQIKQAQRWIHRIGSQHKTATYGDFAAAHQLGAPYKNRIMDLFLAAVLRDCVLNGWPDLASLVIHQASTGQREGPGDSWYKEHGFTVGDIAAWKRVRDDCWNRIQTFTP